MSDDASEPKLPQAIESPLSVRADLEPLRIVEGRATLSRDGMSLAGEASIVFDLLPVPRYRFSFDEETGQRSFFEQMKDVHAGHGLEFDAITFASDGERYPINPIARSNNRTTGILEAVEGERLDSFEFDEIRFLVLNGPSMRGSAIRQGKSVIAGRTSAELSNAHITIDRLDLAKDERLPYKWTHVLSVKPKSALTSLEVDELETSIFQTLSLMSLHWTGLVGKWFYSCGELVKWQPYSTKVDRSRGAQSWHYEQMAGTFPNVISLLSENRRLDPNRAESLTTAIHWLVESEMCAGGVEGAMILQQAALEALAWMQLVEHEKAYSRTEFDRKANAYDRITRLLQRYNIDYSIPGKCESLKAFCQSSAEGTIVGDSVSQDLVELLIWTRSALVHSVPCKIQALINRTDGDDERSDLWFYAGGLLQLALLACLGYTDRTVRRDVDAVFKQSAIRPVPWNLPASQADPAEVP